MGGPRITVNTTGLPVTRVLAAVGISVLLLAAMSGKAADLGFGGKSRSPY